MLVIFVARESRIVSLLRMWISLFPNYRIVFLLCIRISLFFEISFFLVLWWHVNLELFQGPRCILAFPNPAVIWLKCVWCAFRPVNIISSQNWPSVSERVISSRDTLFESVTLPWKLTLFTPQKRVEIVSDFGSNRPNLFFVIDFCRTSISVSIFIHLVKTMDKIKYFMKLTVSRQDARL